MPLDASARGVYPIAPTPFHPDGRIDVASIDRLTDFYVGCGATGLTVLGVMGEAGKLDQAEGIAVATRFIRRAGTLPVIVGVSAPGFAAMAALARAGMEAGAAGVMIAPPSTLRTDDQIVTYYRQAAEAIGPDAVSGETISAGGERPASATAAPSWPSKRACSTAEIPAWLEGGSFCSIAMCRLVDATRGASLRRFAPTPHQSLRSGLLRHGPASKR